jgi:isocitrate lyase
MTEFKRRERWEGIQRDYSAEDVKKLSGSVKIQYTLAQRGADKLWEYLTDPNPKFKRALGCLTGNQAVQVAKAGLNVIYMSGWQVAADANLAGQTYPDQSLYPANSVPTLVKRINNALQRADQLQTLEGNKENIDYFLPIVADAEAGFGGHLNVFEMMKAMIEGGAAGIHLEDQLASEKKCGHMGGKVLVPRQQFIRTLQAARLASDVMGVSTIIVGRTDSNAANLLTSDVDDRDKPFCTGERTPEGFFKIKNGIDAAISRGLDFAPYCDIVWAETATPSLEEATKFAHAIHAKYPGKPLAYNCSPSFNWRAKLGKEECYQFQEELGKLGYKFQFVTLAGFHALNYSMFDLAFHYKDGGMGAYSELQEREFAAEKDGYTATKHQREVGVPYFDAVSMAVTQGKSSTTAMKGSTEQDQFK